MTEPNNHSEQLSAYLDGELSPAEVQQIEQVLANDPALAEELRQLRATRDLLGQLPRTSAGPDFTTRVMQRIGHRPALRVWPRVVAVAATLVVLAGVGLSLLYWNSLTQQPGETGPQPIGEIARDLSGEMDEPSAASTPVAVAPSATPEEVTSELPPPPAERFTADQPRLALDPSAPLAESADEPAASPGERRIVAKGKGAPLEDCVEYDAKSDSDLNSLPKAITKGVPARPGSYTPRPLDEGRLRNTPHLPREDLYTLAKTPDTQADAVIYNNSMRLTQHRVEQVLKDNAITLAAPHQSELLASQAADLNKFSPDRNRQSQPPRVVEYVVYATPEQVAAIRTALEQEVIPQQVVTQAPKPLYQRVVPETQTQLARAEKPNRASDRELLEYYEKQAKAKRKNGSNETDTLQAPLKSQPAAAAPTPVQPPSEPVAQRAGNEAAVQWTRQNSTSAPGEAALANADGIEPVEPLRPDELPASQTRQLDQQAVPVQQADQAQAAQGRFSRTRQGRSGLVAMVIRLRYRPDVPLTPAQRKLLGMDKPARSQPATTPASQPATIPADR
jgi:hypothetical protein